MPAYNEPWRVEELSGNWNCIMDCKNLWHLCNHGEGGLNLSDDDADRWMARIVACVNYCQNIPQDELAGMKPVEWKPAADVSAIEEALIDVDNWEMRMSISWWYTHFRDVKPDDDFDPVDLKNKCWMAYENHRPVICRQGPNGHYWTLKKFYPECDS